MKTGVIHASWLDLDNKKNKHSWCEYCGNHKSSKTYLPFHKNVLNPERICENCVEGIPDLNLEFEVLGFYINEDEYQKDLYKLKK